MKDFLMINLFTINFIFPQNLIFQQDFMDPLKLSLLVHLSSLSPLAASFYVRNLLISDHPKNPSKTQGFL